MHHLGGERFRWLLQVGGVELAQIPRHALLDLSKAALHLCAREILVAVVDSLELAAVDGNARLRQQANLSAKGDKLRAHLADRRPVILAEIGNCLVIGNQPARQPHHLNVAGGFTLKPAARLNPVEITVDVELQQRRRMIRRSAGHFGLDPTEPKFGKIEFVDKNVDDPNRIVLADPVFQTVGKQCALTAIHPFNEAPHLIPPAYRAGIILRESHRPTRFYTARVKRYRLVERRNAPYARNAPKAASKR